VFVWFSTSLGREPQQMDYTFEITKLLNILKSPTKTEDEKLVAENKLKNIKYEIEKRHYGVPEDRIDDVIQLESIIADINTPEAYREVAKKSLHKILHESSIIKSMRKSLVKEMKAGNSQNVLDINDFVSKHSKYRND